MTFRVPCLSALLLLAACEQGPPTAPPPAATPSATPGEAAPEFMLPAIDVSARVQQFAVAELTADISSLPQGEREALNELIEASKLLEPLFDRQAWHHNPELEAVLADATDAAAPARLEYFRIMRGPWDRQNDHEPFAVGRPFEPGAGFYPSDLSADDFRGWVEANPTSRAAFESLFTVIEHDGPSLRAVPYSQAYAQWLEPAAKHLEAAADKTANGSLQTFLRSRAAAFRSDDYYASDKDWMDLDSRVEITIGPYETYEDQLLGLKASFESFVTVSDPEASKALAQYKAYLPKMEQHLPVEDSVRTERGAQSPIRVVDLVFTSGDARKSVQTIAFNLPNDERVRKEKGAKKVLLRNLIETKFDKIMKPIGERVLVPSLHADLQGDAFFYQVLFHELSHSLGPAFTTVDGRKMEVRLALGPTYSALEECKADVMGIYNILFMISMNELPKDARARMLTSYFGGLFRSVRFGVTEAHGKGAAVQINRYIESGAVTVEDGLFSIDFAKLEESIEALVHDLVMLQHNGDRGAAETFMDRYGMVSPPMAAALAKLDGIPVDIRPVYPLAGESAPR